MAYLTQKTLPGPVQAWYDDALLTSPTAAHIHRIPAMKKTLPSRNSPTVRYRRHNRMGVNKVSLSPDGTSIPPAIYSAVDIDATISWYGQWIGINEQVQATSQDPVLNGAAENLAVNMRDTEDELIRDMLASTATYLNCLSGDGADKPTAISKKDIDKATQSLVSSNAFTTLKYMEGQNKIGTTPIPNAFFALTHTDLISDLEVVEGFTPTHKYPNPANALSAEWGAAGRLRFLVSTAGSVLPAASRLGNNVYNIFCVGMESYAVIQLDGNSAEFIYHDKTHSDALEQNATAAFKMAFCPKILNDEWIIALRATKVL